MGPAGLSAPGRAAWLLGLLAALAMLAPPSCRAALPARTLVVSGLRFTTSAYTESTTVNPLDDVLWAGTGAAELALFCFAPGQQGWYLLAHQPIVQWPNIW